MRLKVWEPFRGFKPFYSDVDRLINEFGRGLHPGEATDEASWSPKVDIYETENIYVLNAELPGLKKKEIKIDLNDNTLTLNGEKKFEEKVEKEPATYGAEFARCTSCHRNADGSGLRQMAPHVIKEAIAGVEAREESG